MFFGKNTRKFTLVELLVTVAVISILASLLMPALDKARGQAIASQCLNNLKQTGLAATMYLDDNSGNFATSLSSPASNFWNSILFNNNYVQNRDVFFCPSIEPGEWSESTHAWYTYGARPMSATFTGFDTRSVKNPSRHYFLLDTANRTVTKGYYRVPDASWDVTLGGVHLRHDNRACTWFVDGHAGAVGTEKLGELDWGYTEGETFWSGVDESGSVVNF